MREASRGTFEEYLQHVFSGYKGKMELITPQIIGLKEMEELRKQQKDERDIRRTNQSN